MEYRVWMRWTITHGFYKGGICRGMELSLSPESRNLLRKRGLLWEKRGMNEWCVLGLEEPPAEEDQICFGLQVTDRRLFRVTEEETGQDYQFALVDGEVSHQFEFNSRQLYWEYMLVPRVKRDNRQLELIDTAGLLSFSKAEPCRFMEEEAFRIVSTGPVAYREEYGFQLRLYEQRTMGKKVVSGWVPFPEAGTFADASPGCVRQVVYF